tara:strand:- start:580 stop:1026 length:447 start_codon:yes stop_codon:yes gene_type:complete
MTAVGKAAGVSKGIGVAGWGGIASLLGMGAAAIGQATGNRDLMRIGGLVSTFAEIPGAFQTPGRSPADNSDDVDKKEVKSGYGIDFSSLLDKDGKLPKGVVSDWSGIAGLPKTKWNRTTGLAGSIIDSKANMGSGSLEPGAGWRFEIE